MSIYKALEEAKNGTLIPVFQSGKTMESRYNPERDAENLLNSIEPQNNFFLVLGIGSGLFIELLSKKFPSSTILAFELSKEDLDFLSQLETVRKLKTNSRIVFTSLEDIEHKLLQNYLPARDGNLKVIEQRAWVNENSEKIPEINEVLQKTLGIISADYSVQSHFGKIWNSNILNNTKLAERLEPHFHFSPEILNKTAVVVAAGPSLDKTINSLVTKENRSDFFIISTDTAAPALIKKNIIPEFIVSLDGQAVSYNHFMNCKKTEGKSIYAFDLCANFSAVKYLLENNNQIFFFCSGHPLSSAINAANGYALPQLFSGAGTVTISALDLAVQSGFKDILILGADFSYQNGKAYTSGTYLDTLYNKESFKLSETEKTFSKLMFRTELKSISKEIKTTQILEAYRYSLENYLASKNISFTKKYDIYYLKNLSTSKISDTGIFKKSKKLSLSAFMKKLEKCSPEESEILLLPYVAWLRNNQNYSNYSYKELLKLALDSIVSYNI